MTQKTQVKREEIKPGCLESSSRLFSSRRRTHVHAHPRTPLKNKTQSILPSSDFYNAFQRVWEDLFCFSLRL